jgi:hypothetical protein
MLNFAEQTGSGAVMIVWSFLLQRLSSQYMTTLQSNFHITLEDVDVVILIKLR